MLDWCKMKRGASSNEKWFAAAELLPRKLKLDVDNVASLAWALLDCASEADGSIADFNLRLYAAARCKTVEQVTAMIEALAAVGYVEGKQLKNWAKHQGGVSKSAQRLRDWRERKAKPGAEGGACTEALQKRDETLCNTLKRANSDFKLRLKLKLKFKPSSSSRA